MVRDRSLPRGPRGAEMERRRAKTGPLRRESERNWGRRGEVCSGKMRA